MRPPSYYNTLANANPSSSNRGSTSQQLRSSFASSSSASYVTRTHLPFVSQSMLVAHCYTGAGSTTRPYGQQHSLSTSSSLSSLPAFSSTSTIYSPASYASSYTRPSSTAAATSRRHHLQHQLSFGTGSNSYKSSHNSYHPIASSSRGASGAYSSSAHSSAAYNSSLPPSRSSYLTSATTSHLSPNRVSAASSSSSSSSFSYRRPPTTPTTISYYKPIRLRERPLLTQISRQLNTRYTPSSPSSRVHSVRQGDEPQATPSTRLPVAGASYRATESDKEKEEKWSSDVARNISRNKYLIKFKEFHKRPSIAPIELVPPTSPQAQAISNDHLDATSRGEAIVVDPLELEAPQDNSIAAVATTIADSCISEQTKLLEQNTINNSISGSINNGSSSSSIVINSNSSSKLDPQKLHLETSIETTVVLEKPRDLESEKIEIKLPVLGEPTQTLTLTSKLKPAPKQEKVIGKQCIEKSVEGSIGKSEHKSPGASSKKQVVKKANKILTPKTTKPAGKSKTLASEKEKEPEPPKANIVTEKEVAAGVSTIVIDKRVMLDKTIDRKLVERSIEKPAEKMTKINNIEKGDRKKLAEEKTSANIFDTREPINNGGATTKPELLVEEKKQLDCDKKTTTTTITPPINQVNGTDEEKKNVSKERNTKFRSIPTVSGTGLSKSKTNESIGKENNVPSEPVVLSIKPQQQTTSNKTTLPLPIKPSPEEPQTVTSEAVATRTTARPKVKKLIIKSKTKVEQPMKVDDEQQPQQVKGEKSPSSGRDSSASSGACSPKKAKTKVKLEDRKVLATKQLEQESMVVADSSSNAKELNASPVISHKEEKPTSPETIKQPQKVETPKTPSSVDGLTPTNSNKRIKFREYNIDDFNFLSVLGHGGWGFVILAELKEHDACFAVKCIKKITIVEDDDFDSIMIERKVLALGNVHPFICKLFCTFETDGYLFFVMEYCAGGDLMFHVQREGKFTESRCRFYAAEIICAIRFLHNRHIIYRDLKLDNILLDSRGHVRLVDFGMCQCRTYREEMLPSNFCGTPEALYLRLNPPNDLEYISPEIIKGVPYNHSVDWWSFGVLLYEMVVGKMPFRGNDENELLWNVCYEQIHYPMFLTKELSNLLQLLLEREPTKRMGMATCKAGDIYDQPWFRGVDWVATEEMRVKPPFVPEVNSKRDVQNFDADFTQATPELSPVDESTLQRIDQSQFQKFPYTNPDIFIFN